jgi:beta-glucosidase
MPGDVTFNSNNSYFGANLTMAVNNGSVPLARVDDMAVRVMAGFFLVGQDSGYPAVNFDTFKKGGPLNEHVNVQDDHDDIVRKVGAASTILLKNENNTLPLRKPRTIALLGSDAGPPIRGPNGYPDRGGVDGTLAMGWGSGELTTERDGCKC